MADLGISIAAKLIEVLASESIKQICDTWGYKTELEDLKETVYAIRNVLLDADHEASKRKLTNQEEDYLQKLKYAVYDAEDVFDEFLTLAELNQLGTLSKGGKFFAKVQRFFSSTNQVNQAYRMSRDVKNVRKKLELIAADRKNFVFDNVENRTIIKRDETCSLGLDAKEIIGREDDKKAIVDMLLDQNVNEDACFITIVGVGGLGKTVLAQAVFDDEKIKTEFAGDSRLWVCVGDLDKENFEVKAILCKILELVSKQKFDATNSSQELVVRQFQEKFREKKYFLVLDDVWNEDPGKWLDLKRKLMCGQRGSRILVTTRSEKTKEIIGLKRAYKLDGLSKENSWRLFRVLAFEEGQENQHALVEIGMNIVEKFHGNPLALSVVGSLLRGQDAGKWQTIEQSGLDGIGRDDGDKILSILKFSYYNLKPSLKNCFSFCALFQKDIKIEKEMLISLWMAQGYIVPDRGQSIEDAAEEHLITLLRRHFFENEEKNYETEVEPVKIHDLMHDLAQEVRREEILRVTSPTSKLEDKVRHLSYVGNTCPTSSRTCRSFICKLDKAPLIDLELGNWKCLRVLDLSSCGVKSLPKSIGKLLLLRYLNLSYNRELDALSDEITKLHNLETLLLRGCWNIREFPKDYQKLVKLRHLDLHGCFEFIARLHEEPNLVDTEIGNWRDLRVLDLSSSNLTSLPISIGKLLHLRHLNLSCNSNLLLVSDEITKLHNLQTLLLNRCHRLRHLPKDFSNLSKLRQLDLSEGGKLTGMPLGMEKLTSVTLLPCFVVGRRNTTETGCVDELKALKALTKIKGRIEIVIGENYRKVEGLNDMGRGYLRRLEHLEVICLKFDKCSNNERGSDDSEALLETLEPHRNLKKLTLFGYQGTIIPKWGRAEDNWALSLSNLVSVNLECCSNLQEIPVLSKLLHLKRLYLLELENLEYVEIISNGTEEEELSIFFPSLKYLSIIRLTKLKGWWNGEQSRVNKDHHSKSRLRFPCLSKLSIYGCQNLTLCVLCPSLEVLDLSENNEMLQVTVKSRGEEEEEDDHAVRNSQDDVLLRELKIDNLGLLKSLPINCLTRLSINGEQMEGRLSGEENDISEVFERCASSLKSLIIFESMNHLRRLSGSRGFHKFTALESLELEHFENRETLYKYEDDDLLWKSFPQNLRKLRFASYYDIPKGVQYLTSIQTLELSSVEALPEWIDCLSSLQSLHIYNCHPLTSLPDAMKNLTSLKKLEIMCCRELEERCQKPNGEHWPKIQHIPEIVIDFTTQ